jgi:hypothetical protein
MKASQLIPNVHYIKTLRILLCKHAGLRSQQQNTTLSLFRQAQIALFYQQMPKFSSSRYGTLQGHADGLHQQ